MRCRSFVPSAAARLGAILLLVAASGCGSAPVTRFHTLLEPPMSKAAATEASKLAWELLPVVVPVQVDQPQLVVRADDGTLALRENERWIAPLADEYRAALVDRLTQALGVPPTLAEAPRGSRLWRVRVDVQRFDSVPDRYALEELNWSLRPAEAAGGDALLACHGKVEVPVGAGYPALTAGHRQAVERFAAAIAASLRALDAGQTADCPSMPGR
jgi:uncharacterized lipoprotein YmbA